MHIPLTLMLWLPLLAHGLAGPAKRQALKCNRFAALCDRPYDQVVYLGAHDSPFLRDASTDDSLFGNQYVNSTVQLNQGVRLLTAQLHPNSAGAQHLCHTSCDYLDAGPLQTFLAQLRAWLDAHPDEVVTLLLVNDGASAGTLNDIFVAAGIAHYAYTPPSTTTAPPANGWPTLRTLIAAGKRLVVFVAPLDPATNTVAPYLLDEFTFVWENPYQVTKPGGYSCQPERPPAVAGSFGQAFASGRIALMNHFLDKDIGDGIYIPAAGRADMTNAPLGGQNAGVGSLGVWARRCTNLWGRKPTFLLVDWENKGPAIVTVHRLNGVSG